MVRKNKNKMENLNYKIVVKNNKVECSLLIPNNASPLEYLIENEIDINRLNHILTSETLDSECKIYIELHNKLLNLKKANQTELIKKARLSALHKQKLLAPSIASAMVVLFALEQLENISQNKNDEI